MTLPRLLVLDDLFFWSREDRRVWCRKLGLADVTEGEVDAVDCIAEAVFRSPQVRTTDKIVNSIDQGMKEIASGWKGGGSRNWSLVLLDLQFDEGVVNPGSINPDTNWPEQTKKTFGLEMLEALAEVWPDPDAPRGNCEVPVVMLSRLAREQISRQAGRAGARAYIEKQDFSRDLLEDLLREHGLIEDPSGLLIGTSLPLLKTLRSARQIAISSRGNLLILGETGSGKTILAEYIHNNSPRSVTPLHAFTVSEGYEPVGLNAELFGYWHGAFTDANQSEPGKAERAHTSTLLIDEIGNLPKASQGLLLEYCRLRADGHRKLKRLGNFPVRPDLVRQANESTIGQLNRTTQEIAVDVFLVSATNSRIDDPSYRQKISFRDDLYYRIAEEYHKSIEFPTLAERSEDVEQLFTSYLESTTREIRGVWPKELSEGVVEQLKGYDWPGNVAQLKGVAREVAKNAKNWDEVSLRHLPELIPTRTHPAVLDQENGSSIGEGRTHSNTGEVTKEPTIDEVLARFEDIKISSSRNGLRGKLARVQEVSARLVMRLLEAALEETKDAKGELQPTSAMKRLLDQTQLPSTDAASILLRLSKNFPEAPPEDSNLALALHWAKKRRR